MAPYASRVLSHCTRALTHKANTHVLRTDAGTDASKWYVEKINYADRLWDSAEDLLAWYEANNRTTPGFAPYTPRKRPYGTSTCCSTPTCLLFVIHCGQCRYPSTLGATRKLDKCITGTLSHSVRALHGMQRRLRSFSTAPSLRATRPPGVLLGAARGRVSTSRLASGEAKVDSNQPNQ